MEILKDIEIIDLALYLKKHKAIIISDVHLGYEEDLNKKGVLAPLNQFKDTMKKLEKILKNKKLNYFIINGDLKHEFGIISRTEWKNVSALLDFLKQHSKNIILIEGNHDITLDIIAKKKNLELANNFSLDDIYIAHGDKIPKDENFKKAKIIITGHEHPAISISDDTRTEKYKCFLKGKYKNKTLIVTPAFNVLTIGTDILKNKLLSPFLQQNLSNFDIFIVQDKVYNFGKVKNIT
ncbi:MAG: metallophosphoesterase [Candidatus Woesearchaeota archaeon]|nr:MAG: metallophosphoesterase [Candidatus Woesearchaeota archaeon]